MGRQRVVCRGRTRQRCLLLLLTVLVVTILIWYNTTDKDYQFFKNYKACTEAVYNFPNESSSVLTDTLLWSKCEQRASAEKKRKSAILKREYKLLGQVPVFTKCGAGHAVLISKVPSTVEQKLVERYDIDGSSTEYPVPNIVHYISLGSWEFSFLNYISFLSAHKFIKPWAIYVHGQDLPTGKWWNRTIYEVPNIYQVARKKPNRIQGREIGWLEHSTDVMRLQTILDNGGIYLDTDVIVLKSFDPLRMHELTLGRETTYGLGSSIVIGQPESAFVCVWREAFRSYAPYPWNWAKYAVWTPHALARKLPEHIHIETKHLLSPTWAQSDLLFNKVYNWKDNYAIHVWKRFGEVPDNPDDIKALNTTLGQIMRFVFYGAKDLKLESSENQVVSKNRLFSNFRTTVDVVGDKLLTLFGFNN